MIHKEKMPTSLLKDFKALLKLAKENGVTRLRCGTIEFDLRQEWVPAVIKNYEDPKPIQTEIPIVGETMPADDEMLFYSSDSAIQAQK